MAMRLSGAHEPTIPNCHNCRRGGEAGEVRAAEVRPLRSCSVPIDLKVHVHQCPVWVVWGRQ